MFCRYGLNESDADTVVKIARQTQVEDSGHLHPVSLVDIWSPSGLLPSSREKQWRSMAVEVASKLPGDYSSLDVLRHIFEKLKPFGMDSLKIDDKWKRLIKDELARLGVTQGGTVHMKMLLCYHSMLWKTGQGWTYHRTPEEMSIKWGYHPNTLSVFGDVTREETRLSGEVLEPLDLTAGQLDADLAAAVGNYDEWKKIGVVEFFASALTLDKPLLGPTSQNMVAVSVEEVNQWACVPVTQEGLDRGEQRWPNTLSDEEFMLSNSMKRLYDIRPHEVEEMVYAQFLTQYRPVDKGGREERDLKKKMGESSTVGPPSDALVAGT